MADLTVRTFLLLILLAAFSLACAEIRNLHRRGLARLRGDTCPCLSWVDRQDSLTCEHDRRAA